jgi:glycogen synthase
MKILLLAQSFPPPPAAGSVQYIANIYSALPPHTAVIATSNTEPVLAKEFDACFPQRIVRLPFIPHVTDGYKASKFSRASKYILWPLAAAWLIFREKPQVVHIGEYNAAVIAALIAKKLFHIPYVLFTYVEELTYITFRPTHLRLLKRVVRNADAIITVSDATS